MGIATTRIADASSATATTAPAQPVVIETDKYLGEANGDNWTPAGFEKAWQLSLAAFAEALQQPGARRAVLVLGIPGAGKSTLSAAAKRPGDVILDEAKLVYAERRDAATAVALQSGLPVEVIWVDTPLRVCKERNNLRASNRRVPDLILEEADRLLDTHPPTPREGFAAIHQVSGQGPTPMHSTPTQPALGAPRLPALPGCRELCFC
jgi:predicted kinase